MPPLGNVLPGKPAYFGLIIGLLLCGLIVGGIYYLGVTEVDKQIASSKAELDELQKKIEAGRSAEKKLPQFREEVARLEQELDKLRRILPSSRNTEEIIKKIKSLVDQGNLDLKSLSFPEPVPSGESDVYADWNITVTLEGGYHNLAILYDRLSNFSRIINVEKFTITALQRQDAKTLSCEFVARTFVYIEKETEPEPVAAPGAEKKPGGNP